MRQVRTAYPGLGADLRQTLADPGRFPGVEAASVLAWVSKYPDVCVPLRAT